MIYLMKLKYNVLNANRMAWRRKNLRRKETLAEKLLWGKLRNNQLGVKFKRQYSVMNYVIDFYCHSAKLAIEIDGGIHAIQTNRKYDMYRTDYIKSLGINEIRFNNYDVLNNLEIVILHITNNLPSPEIRRGIRG